MTAPSKDRPPHGHTEISRAAFDRLVWPNYAVELPGPGGGWATTKVDEHGYATWMPGVTAS